MLTGTTPSVPYSNNRLGRSHDERHLLVECHLDEALTQTRVVAKSPE
jgi:hypothetical protein